MSSWARLLEAFDEPRLQQAPPEPPGSLRRSAEGKPYLPGVHDPDDPQRISNKRRRMGEGPMPTMPAAGATSMPKPSTGEEQEEAKAPPKPAHRRRDLTVGSRHKDSGIQNWTRYANRVGRRNSWKDIEAGLQGGEHRSTAPGAGDAFTPMGGGPPGENWLGAPRQGKMKEPFSDFDVANMDSEAQSRVQRVPGGWEFRDDDELGEAKSNWEKLRQRQNMTRYGTERGRMSNADAMASSMRAMKRGSAEPMPGPRLEPGAHDVSFTRAIPRGGDAAAPQPNPLMRTSIPSEPAAPRRRSSWEDLLAGIEGPDDTET